MSLNHNMFISENMEFVNEAYVGKTPTLEKIEKKLGELRPKIKYSGANNTLKETLEINRLFEEQFGMDVFALNIEPNDNIDASTFPFFANYDIAESENFSEIIISDKKNGYRFRKNNNFCIMVNISTGLLMNDNYTDAEILAIILHEIGHNFQGGIDEFVYNFYSKNLIELKKEIIQNAIEYAVTITGIPKAVKEIEPLFTHNNSINNKNQKKNQKVGNGKLSAFIKSIKPRVKNIKQLIIYIYDYLFDIEGIYNSHVKDETIGDKDIYRIYMGRRMEIFADKFVGVYGYGPDLATSFFKFESEIRSAKVLKFISGFLGKYGEEISAVVTDLSKDDNMYDEHPHHIQRINENIKLLENELKKQNIDPKMKKVIQKQLDQIKKIVKDHTTLKVAISKSEQIKILYNQFINNECPDSVEKEIEDKIEEALDKALNGGN